jgi:subtilisin family serine protease
LGHYPHPDLVNNMWHNPGEIPGNGIDDDNNGYVDDYYGYNFVGTGNSDPFDDFGHGTHVAGTIGATGNNSTGIVGVNWTIQLMALKFVDASGMGSNADAIEAINYATAMRSRGINIKLTNNSWGGAPFDQSLMTAIQNSGNAGMLFVASAGNSGQNNDVTPFYPASYNLPNVVAVAATDNNDQLASFSNYGASSVDVTAPGVNILSTVPATGFPGIADPSRYNYLSGTSQAAPHVSGTAALVWSLYPGVTYQEVRDAIIAGVDPKSGLAGKVRSGGRLNAFGALQRYDKDIVITGADAGGASHVRVFFARPQVATVEKFGFFAFPAGFTGGVRVAAADVTGDGIPDLITATGPGGGPQVNVYDGRTAALLSAFFAYASSFSGGVFVGAGDINNDGFADVITGAGGGGGPEVKVFSGGNLSTVLFDQFVYDPGFRGGARVAAGDTDKDGYADIITAAGPGGGPQVNVYSGRTHALLRAFFAYASSFTGGVYVGGGDVNGDGFADILTGAGAGGGPQVSVFSGATGATLTSFFAFATSYTGGVRVAAADVNGDGKDDIITAQGTGPNAHEKIFDGSSLALLLDQTPYDGAGVGVFVGGKRRRF